MRTVSFKDPDLANHRKTRRLSIFVSKYQSSLHKGPKFHSELEKNDLVPDTVLSSLFTYTEAAMERSRYGLAQLASAFTRLVFPAFVIWAKEMRSVVGWSCGGICLRTEFSGATAVWLAALKMDPETTKKPQSVWDERTKILVVLLCFFIFPPYLS